MRVRGARVPHCLHSCRGTWNYGCSTSGSRTMPDSAPPVTQVSRSHASRGRGILGLLLWLPALGPLLLAGPRHQAGLGALGEGAQGREEERFASHQQPVKPSEWSSTRHATPAPSASLTSSQSGMLARSIDCCGRQRLFLPPSEWAACERSCSASSCSSRTRACCRGRSAFEEVGIAWEPLVMFAQLMH